MKFGSLSFSWVWDFEVSLVGDLYLVGFGVLRFVGCWSVRLVRFRNLSLVGCGSLRLVRFKSPGFESLRFGSVRFSWVWDLEVS